MTALLEIKQKIKNFYSRYEIYFLPVFKFVLGFVYFIWINANMGYMSQLDNIFVIVILALICCILPSPVMLFAGYMLMLGHSYALGLEAAGFMLVLILVMTIFFLRFSRGYNIVLAFTPLSFGFNVPVLLPIGSGLLGSPLSAIPAGCGVILYYFIRLLKAQSKVLTGTEIPSMNKLKLLADGMVQNWAMWITVIAFVVVVLIVNLIRTRAFDHAWHIAIVAGGICYVVVMLVGSLFMNITVFMTPLLIYTVVSVLVGLLLEFFVFGGDYSRTERLEYEDDEYYYYVKAVPKASVAASERSIKKINAETAREEKKPEDRGSVYAAPGYRSEEKLQAKPQRPAPQPVAKPEVDDFDFEKKLEESLKDL